MIVLLKAQAAKFRLTTPNLPAIAMCLGIVVIRHARRWQAKAFTSTLGILGAFSAVVAIGYYGEVGSSL